MAEFLSPSTPTEAMLLQHEERLHDLEKNRPCHEALGNYQDVANLLHDSIPKLTGCMKNVDDYVSMYLLTFHKIPEAARVEQCWHIGFLCRAKSWRLLSRLLYHTVRQYGRDFISSFCRERPFLDDDVDSEETTASFSFTSDTLPLPAQLMQHLLAPPAS